MSELEHVADDLERAWAGESWSGPALKELLEGVTPQQAASRPLAGAHSIWELVLHIAAWHGVVRTRMQGKKLNALPPERNFPRVTEASAVGWSRAKKTLVESNRETVEAIRRFPAAKLDKTVPGKPYNYRHMLAGVSHHDAYHAGQIALLKKAMSGEP